MAAPAVRVGVKVVEPAEQQAPFLEVGEQRRVGVLEEDAANQLHGVVEGAVGANRVDERQVVGAAHDHVVLTEGGRLVHQTGAVGGGDVVGQHDIVGGGGELDEIEGPLVVPAFHLGSPERATARPFLTQHRVEQRFRDHEAALFGMRADDVVDLGMHRDRRVGDQRPGGGGPHQQIGLPGERPGGDGETHVDRRVGDVLVALREFVIGQGGAAARAVRSHSVVLLQEALVEDLLERPPHRLHVLGGHGDVGLVEVHPVPHAAGQLGEGVDVPQHRFATLRVERLHPVGLDVGFTGETEFLLDGEFDGQAVAVPTGLAVDAATLHCLETRKQVLEDTGLNVVRPGHAVGGRRALVEGPRIAVAGVLEGLRERVALGPQGDDLALQGGEINGCRDCVVGTHRYLGW